MSTPPLFLVDELPSGDVLSLTGDEGRHAARVKRLSVGEPVLVSERGMELLQASLDRVVAAMQAAWLSYWVSRVRTGWHA